MGDSQYWTSLWVLGLFIFFGLFCLYLTAAVFGLFSDRISSFEPIQAILLEHRSDPHYNPTSVIIGPGGAVVMTGRTAEPERLQDLMELARKLDSAVR